MYLYDKRVYFFQNKHADSLEYNFFFRGTLSIRNLILINFTEDIIIKQDSSLRKSVWNTSDVPMIFVTSKIAQVSTFKQVRVEWECFHLFCFFTFIPVPLSSLLLPRSSNFFSPFLWETTQNDPQGLTCR